MDTNPDITPEEASREAVHKAKSAQQAIEFAREAQMAQMVTETAQKTKDALLEGLKQVFGDTSDSDSPNQMKILVRRIPILCTHFEKVQQDIGDIKLMVKDNSSDHETRLRVIEKNMWKWIGILMIVPPFVTIGIAWLISLLVNK